jgi:Tfp pilus assembly protein PilF
MGNRFTDLALIKDEVAKAEYAIGVRKYDLALSLMQQALQDHPENSVALQTIGRIYTIQGKYLAALEAVLDALQQDPEYPGAHNIYGLIAQQLQLYDEAEQAFRKAIELKPIYHNAHHSYSEFLLSIRKDTARAKEHCLKALELAPTNARYYKVLASIYIAEDNFQLAEETYLQGLRLDPESISLHNGYGAFLINQRRTPKVAFEHFRIALMRDPTDANIRKNFFITLKVKNPLYWLFWQYNSLRRKPRMRFILFMIIVILSIPGSLALSNPAWMPFLLVLFFLYFLFVIYVFTINPLFTFLIKRGLIK